MKFQLQYASNLFVDLHKRSFDTLLRPSASHLTLLGNIGRPESPKTYSFLKFCSSNWKTVLWIPGPHEVSNPNQGHATMSERATNALALSKQFPNVGFFHGKERVFFDQRIVLVGAPLWSSLRLPPKGQSEFTRCFTSTDEAGPLPLSLAARNALSKQDLQFLVERKLFWSIVAPQASLVFLTHTLPTPCLLRRPLGDKAWTRLPMDMMDMRSFMEPPVKAWLGGATGTTHQIQMGTDPAAQVSVGVNGLFEYPYDGSSNEHYDPEAVLELGIPRFPMPRLRLPSSLDEPKVSLDLS